MLGRIRGVDGGDDGLVLGQDLRGCGALPKQVLVEFHHRFPGVGKQRTAQAIADLRKLGYRVFGISETGREVSFVLE